MTIAELQKSLRGMPGRKCRKKDLDPDYAPRRLGNTKILWVTPGYYLSYEVVRKLKLFPADARVGFTPPVFDGIPERGQVSAKEEDPDRNMDLTITWVTARGISIYRFHLIPSWAIKEA